MLLIEWSTFLRSYNGNEKNSSILQFKMFIIFEAENENVKNSFAVDI